MSDEQEFVVGEMYYPSDLPIGARFRGAQVRNRKPPVYEVVDRWFPHPPWAPRPTKPKEVTIRNEQNGRKERGGYDELHGRRCELLSLPE